MRILVVSQYYYPEQFRITDICESLTENGHDITVLTGLPNYPSGIIFDGYEGKQKRTEIINNVNVIRCSIRPRKTGTMNLLFNYLSYMIRASFRILKIRKKFDLIMVYQLSPVLMTVPAIILKRREKIPIFLYCCDIWPESIRDIFKSEKGIPYKFARLLSSSIYKQCDMIAVSSEPFIKYLHKVCGVEEKRMQYIPQHAEDLYHTRKNQTTIHETYRFIFMGNIGLSQQCEIIVKAVERISTDKQFEVHFVGDGSKESEIRQYVVEKKLEDKVKFHGRHPVSEMPKYLQMADVCLLTLADENMIGQTIPAKLQSYMASGKMILAAAGKPIQDVIEKSGCGICVPAGDFSKLAIEMGFCIDRTYDNEEYGAKGEKYFLENYSRRIVIEKLETQMDNLLKGQPEHCYRNR